MFNFSDIAACGQILLYLIKFTAKLKRGMLFFQIFQSKSKNIPILKNLQAEIIIWKILPEKLKFNILAFKFYLLTRIKDWDFFMNDSCAFNLLGKWHCIFVHSWIFAIFHICVPLHHLWSLSWLIIFTWSAIELGKRSRRWERPETQSPSSDARFWSASLWLPRSWRSVAVYSGVTNFSLIGMALKW